jgi:Flp pilus assembly protein TadB
MDTKTVLSIIAACVVLLTANTAYESYEARQERARLEEQALIEAERQRQREFDERRELYSKKLKDDVKEWEAELLRQLR